MNTGSHKRRNRTFMLVALLFVAPLLVALAMRIIGWEPGGMGNHGELVEPPVPLPSGAMPEPWHGHWVLVANTSPLCQADCAGLVDDLLRVRRALGTDGDRVRLVLNGPDQVPDSLRKAPLETAPVSLRRYLRSENVGMAPGSLLVIDPRGFLMMRYAPGFRAGGLLEDLERLLRYSRVGVQSSHD